MIGLARGYNTQNKVLGILLATLIISMGVLGSAQAQDESKGETPWRWIGIRANANKPCPQPQANSGWSTNPLFPGAENRELKRFCLYERKSPANLQALRSLGLRQLGPDIMGIATQGSSLSDQTWQALESHFLSQVGQVDLPAGPPTKVRLAVLDSSPTNLSRGAHGPEDMPANSPHGTALLNMARDLLCDNAETTCRAHLASRLALAYECFDPKNALACRNERRGGYLGLIGELAQVIHTEVQDLGSSQSGNRLVLNLSLAWQPSLGGTESKVRDMPVPMQAVFRALEDASCRGVLTIAAAGNLTSIRGSLPGPLLPARWETWAAPKASRCQGLGITSPASGPGPSSYRPLLFSVTAVGESGAPLVTTQPRGNSRLAAFGDHATVSLSQGSGNTGTLTGSSVAALAISSTAAAFWSYRPQATSFEVMESLYLAGTPTGHRADYCVGSKRCPSKWSETREVSLCASIEEACSKSPTCSATPCPAPQAIDLSEVSWKGFEKAVSVDLSKLSTEISPKPSCGGETVLYDSKGDMPTEPCPHAQYPATALEPWTEPQPESIPCPNCIATFSSPGTLYFEVDALWKGELTAGTLKCGTNSYAWNLEPLRAGDRRRLTAVPESCLEDSPTFLSFLDSNNKAVIVPLYLCQNCT